MHLMPGRQLPERQALTALIAPDLFEYFHSRPHLTDPHVDGEPDVRIRTEGGANIRWNPPWNPPDDTPPHPPTIAPSPAGPAFLRRIPQPGPDKVTTPTPLSMMRLKIRLRSSTCTGTTTLVGTMSARDASRPRPSQPLEHHVRRPAGPDAPLGPGAAVLGATASRAVT